MATDLAGLARKFEATADAIDGAALKRAMNKGGMAGKKAALHVAEQVAGSDRAILMGGRRKVHMNAGYDIEANQQLAINLRPPGLWVLMDTGTKKHGYPIPRVRKRRSKNPKKVLLMANGEFAASVSHPGNSGHKAIRRAAARITEKAPDATMKAMMEEVVKAWR